MGTSRAPGPSRSGSTLSFMRQIRGKDTDAGLYRMLKELGKGTYGRVYKCERLSDGAIMACKVQQSRSTYDDWSTKRELTVWRTACNASIYVVRVYDASYNIDTHEVRMYTELCEGGDTYHLSRQISMCRDEPRVHPLIVYHVGVQLAWALADIQAKRILHRDIKTDNLLMTMKITNEMNYALWQLTERGSLLPGYEAHITAYCDALYERDQRLCVLTDFGLSRDETNVERSTRTVGPNARWTVGTSAPELEFENHQSPMADIYSAGVLIYMFIIRKLPPPPGKAFDRLPDYFHPDLQRLVDECLDHDPLMRPTAGAMVKRLLKLKVREGHRLDRRLQADTEKKYVKQCQMIAAEQARQAELELLAAQRDAEAAAHKLAEAQRWQAHLERQAEINKGPTQLPGRTTRLTKEQRAAHLSSSRSSGSSNTSNPAPPFPVPVVAPAPARAPVRDPAPAPIASTPNPAWADDAHMRQLVAQRERENEVQSLMDEQRRRQAAARKQNAGHTPGPVIPQALPQSQQPQLSRGSSQVSRQPQSSQLSRQASQSSQLPRQPQSSQASQQQQLRQAQSKALPPVPVPDISEARTRMPPGPQAQPRQRARDMSVDPSRMPPPFPPALQKVIDEEVQLMKQRERASARR